MNIQNLDTLDTDQEDLADHDIDTADAETAAIFQELAQNIDEADQLYGEEAVALALETLFPNFDAEEPETTFPDMPVKENIGSRIFNWAGKNSSTVINYVKGLATKAGRARLAAARTPAAKAAAAKKIADAKKLAALGGAGATGGTVTSIAGNTLGSAAGGAASSFVNKDVSIDGISTNDALNVNLSRESSGKLEDLLSQTNDAIAKMTQTMLDTQLALGTKLDSVDDSIDDSIAAETGETAGQVKTRQGIAGRSHTDRTKKKKKGKPVVTAADKSPAKKAAE